MICAGCLESMSATPCAVCGADGRLDGRYTLQAVLGEGGSGMTWRALGPDGPVAVKEIPLRVLDAKRRELVEREARVLAELDHPAIPRLREHFVLGSGRERALFLVQDLVDGTTLEAEALQRRYTEGEVCGIIAEVADILADLHARVPPLVHRDIKPANLIRRGDGRLALVDFGAVRDIARDRDLGGSTVAGTFGYMAPEQFRGDASPATDLFGLGATAVRLLARQEPHRLQGWDQRMEWRRAVRVSPELGALIDGLVQLDEAHRLDDARSVARQARAIGVGRRQSDTTAREVVRGSSPSPAPAPAPALASPRRVDEIVQRLLERLLFLREGRLARRRDAGVPVDTRERAVGLGLGAAVAVVVVVLVGIGGAFVATGEAPNVLQRVVPGFGGAPAVDGQAAAQWAVEVAAQARSSGAAQRACGSPGPRVVPLMAVRGGGAAPPVHLPLSPPQRCWAEVVAPGLGEVPAPAGTVLWVVPDATVAGPLGVRLDQPGGTWWVDVATGAVRDSSGNTVAALGSGGEVPP